MNQNERHRLQILLDPINPSVFPFIMELHEKNILDLGESGDPDIPLDDAYPWDDTPQGYNYWFAIFEFIHTENASKRLSLSIRVLQDTLAMKINVKPRYQFDDTQPI